MVDGVSGNNSDKIWQKIANTTQDCEYLNGLDKQVDSILKGKKEIDISKLRKNSLFANLSEKELDRFNQIIALDGNSHSVSRDELKILYAMTDGKLKEDAFTFDFSVAEHTDSALQEATTKEYQAFVENITANDSEVRHIRRVDISKYDRAKSFEQKIQSTDPNEVMLAISDEIMTDYVNPKTGEKMTITKIVSEIAKFVKANPMMGYEDICANIKQQLGVDISNYGRYRGSGDHYQIGDWKIDTEEGVFSRKTIYNAKTNQAISGQDADWSKNTPDTIPNTQGFTFIIDTYADDDGNILKFKRQKDVDTIQPSGLTIYKHGDVKTITYNISETLDPAIYNFVYSD